MPRVIDADLYEQDFYAWTQIQGAKLRRLQEQQANVDLDLPHLVEEVEDLGKAERDALRSHLRRIIEHCLKLEYSPARDPRLGWYETVINARSEIHQKMTPTLRRDLDESLGSIYKRAQRTTAQMLHLRKEDEAAEALPADCPYALDNLLDDSWYPANRLHITD